MGQVSEMSLYCFWNNNNNVERLLDSGDLPKTLLGQVPEGNVFVKPVDRERLFYMEIWDKSVCCVILIEKKTTEKPRATL